MCDTCTVSFNFKKLLICAFSITMFLKKSLKGWLNLDSPRIKLFVSRNHGAIAKQLIWRVLSFL